MKFKTWVVRAQYAANRALAEGLWWTVKEMILRTALWLVWLCLLPITLIFHFLGYRRLPVLTQHIGHLAGELDCFFKLMGLDQAAIPDKRYFVLAPAHKVSNACLLDYWRDHIDVFTHPALCWLLEVMTRSLLMRYSIETYLLAVGHAARYFEIEARWADRPPLLKLKSTHEAHGNRFLLEAGLPVTAWFVCVHAREGGYAAWDENIHDYRNMTVEFLFPAMREIVSRGGWCFRMGDDTMVPLPPMPGVIDYAHHQSRSAKLDIFLCAQCRFFLGNTSGLFLVSTIFGVPSALTNQVPFAATGFRPGDLSIPKRIRRWGSTDFLTSAEILDSPISNFRMSRLYAQAQLELVENSSEEILDLVLEMLDILDGRSHDRPEAALCQAGFLDHLRPWHYCYGTAGKISDAFLLRHKQMFLKPAVKAGST